MGLTTAAGGGFAWPPRRALALTIVTREALDEHAPPVEFDQGAVEVLDVRSWDAIFVDRDLHGAARFDLDLEDLIIQVPAYRGLAFLREVPESRGRLWDLKCDVMYFTSK